MRPKAAATAEGGRSMTFGHRTYARCARDAGLRPARCRPEKGEARPRTVRRVKWVDQLDKVVDFCDLRTIRGDGFCCRNYVASHPYFVVDILGRLRRVALIGDILKTYGFCWRPANKRRTDFVGRKTCSASFSSVRAPRPRPRCAYAAKVGGRSSFLNL